MYRSVCCVMVVTGTVTGSQMGLFITWQCQMGYLTGAQCFWSEGTPSRARRTPSKMQHLLRLFCGSSSVRRHCRPDRMALQFREGPGSRTQEVKTTTVRDLTLSGR